MVLSGASTGNPFPSLPMWLLEGFSSSMVVGLRVSVAHQIVADGYLRFLATWASPTGQLARKACKLRRQQRAQNPSHNVILHNVILEVAAHHFCIFYWLLGELLGPVHTQKERMAQGGIPASGAEYRIKVRELLKKGSWYWTALENSVIIQWFAE